MKRCPKCNRTFPDENQKFCTYDGGLLMADHPAPAFDPHLTVRTTSTELVPPTSESSASEAVTSTRLPDLNATVAASAPTEAIGRARTSPTGRPTSSDLAAPSSSLPTPPVSGIPVPGPIAVPERKSKLPWILGGLAVLLLIGIGGLAGIFFLMVKPRLEAMRERPVIITTGTNSTENQNNAGNAENTNPTNTNSSSIEAKEETDTFVPPADAVEFTNSKANLDGRLAASYFDFRFYYPKAWVKDPKAGVAGSNNFVKVERSLPPDFTQENFAVGWYPSRGTFDADKEIFPQLVEVLGITLSKNFPEYRKVSEGPTKVNSLDAWEFRFESLSKETEKGDIKVWGRVVFLPPGVQGQNKGAKLIMLATSLAPELAGVEDVGVKGEMPIILESFRFGPQK
jgi:hypothetical protein